MSPVALEVKNPTRVAAGLKAAIHNPNVSEEAKARAAERLAIVDPNAEAEHVKHIVAGYRGTLHNARTSDEAKCHAAEVLTAAGYFIEKPDDTTDDEH